MSTKAFDNPAKLVNADDLRTPVQIVGANDLTTEIAEDPEAFAKWQRQTRVAGALKISHDTDAMRERWSHACKVSEQDEAIEMLRRFEHRGKDPVGAMLSGRPGRGKSHLAGRTTQRLRELGEPAVWISTSRMLDDLRDLARGDNAALSVTRYRERLETALWLVMDDLGAERPTDFALEQICTLLDARFNNRDRCKTLITTNLETTDLYDRLGPRAASRLVGLCKGAIVAVPGDDLRLKGVA